MSIRISGEVKRSSMCAGSDGEKAVRGAEFYQWVEGDVRAEGWPRSVGPSQPTEGRGLEAVRSHLHHLQRLRPLAVRSERSYHGFATASWRIDWRVIVSPCVGCKYGLVLFRYQADQWDRRKRL